MKYREPISVAFLVSLLFAFAVSITGTTSAYNTVESNSKFAVYQAKVAGVSTIAVASTATVYTDAVVSNPKNVNREVYWQLTSAGGTPSVTIQEAQCLANPTANAADTVNCSVATDNPDLVTSDTTETLNHKAYGERPGVYKRWKITGTGANPADTTVMIKSVINEVN